MKAVSSEATRVIKLGKCHFFVLLTLVKLRVLFSASASCPCPAA